MKEILIPKQIKIGGFTYRIEIGADDDELIDSNLMGQCSNSRLRISLESRINLQQMSQTFIHELCHAINNVYNNNNCNEDEISSISQGLFQVCGELGIQFSADVPRGD